MTTRVYGWMSDQAGCGYYRVRLPLSTLPRDRWDVSHSEIIPLHWHEDAEVVLAQRVLEDATSGLWRDICRNPNVLAVYEVDDDLLNIDPTSISWEFYQQPHIRRNFIDNIRIADRVTTSTPYLAELLSKHNPNVVLVPNYVPAATLDIARPAAADGVVIGYSSSATHDMDYAIAAPHLRRILTRYPDAIVHFIGASYPGLPDDRVRWTQFIQGVPEYLKHVALFDIGIAPLKPHVFNRSKSHIKALEYAALGIPSVVSRFVPYEDFVRHGETGFLVGRDHEFPRALRDLIVDPDLRAAMGVKARDHAAAYTIEGNIRRWEAALTP